MRLKKSKLCEGKKKNSNLQPSTALTKKNSSYEGEAIESVPEADVAVQHDIWLPRALPSFRFVPFLLQGIEERALTDTRTVDAEIIKDATKCKIDLAGGLQRTLHGAVKPSTLLAKD